MSPTLQKNHLKAILEKQDPGFLGGDTALTTTVKGFSLPFSLIGGQGACLTGSSSGRQHSKMRGATLCPQKVLSTTEVFYQCDSYKQNL